MADILNTIRTAFPILHPRSNTPMADPQQEPTGSLADVQRALALLIIGILVIATLALIVRLVISAPVDDVSDLAKIMLAALVNMGLIALGFYFGSSKSKDAADATQARLVDKLTPPAAPVVPAPTAPVPPWWVRMNDTEKNAITTAGQTDPRVQAFITASQNGAASADDLTYLVSKGLLTQARADAIQVP